MTTDRRLAVTAALLYLVTWITSVAALPLYAQGGRTQVLGEGSSKSSWQRQWSALQSRCTRFCDSTVPLARSATSLCACWKLA